MLTLFVKKGVIGDGPVYSEQFPFVEGSTPRSVVNLVASKLPRTVPIDVAMHGRLLEEEDYDRPLKDGDEVVFCGHVAGGIDLVALLVQAIIAAALSVAVNYALAALNPQPTVPDVPQDRGDETSQTYAWSGIATNYGQGFIVGAVYGRHGVGGQVITTDVNTGESSSGGYLIDQLNVLLALSEGPIDKIGDVEIPDNGADFLGSTLTQPGTGSLPSDIRVNDVELVNEGNPVFGQQISYPFSTTWFSNTNPDLRSGDTMHLWNKSLGVQVAGTTRIARYVYNGPQGPANPPLNASVLLVMENIPAAWDTALNNPANYNLRIGQAPGDPGEFALFQSYSQTTLVPDVAGALAYLRKGTLEQPPMPANGGGGPGGPWIGASTTFSPGNQLNEFGSTAVFAFNTGEDPIQRVLFTLAAPVGLYQQDQQGNVEPFSVFFTFQWRYEGETSWRDFSNPLGQFIGLEVRTGPWLWTINRSFGAPVVGNVEVKVQRTVASGGVGTVSSVTWRDVTFGTGYQLGYPRVACLGLTLEANARWNGGLPNFNVRVDGIKLRIWDSVEGWSDPTWEVPAAPFDWHINPPGRNPAWILLDFLLADWGLGHYVTEDDIDLESFARWAVYCDEEPGTGPSPWGEARFTCDIVLDRARPAWEWVLAICATGRASPVFVDGKIGVVYEYSDAHAQGNVSVPAKTVTQLFTTGNLSDMTVTWLPRANRPTSFVYQFLNEDFEWRQDVLPFEDEEATFNDSSELFPDEYRPQQVQAFGQTRPSQIYRDSVYRHRVGRLIARKIDFKTGRWALASQIGDLIDVEAEIMRPFDNGVSALVADVATACAVWDDVVTSTSFLVDHANIPASGAIKIRQPDGSPIVTTYTVTITLTTAGRNLAQIATAVQITADKGAPCVIGTVDKLTETYQIVAVTMNDDLTHSCTALQWVPEVHDPVPQENYQVGGDDSVIPEAPATQEDGNVFERELMVNANLSGSHEVNFARLPQRAGVPARVYVRADEDSVWTLAGVTESDTVDIGKRRAHQTVQVAVAPESLDGDALMVEMSRIATIKVPEFTQIVPPSISNPTWHEVQGTLMLKWDEITTQGVEFYEIREGFNWNGGRVLARTPDTRFVFEVPPQTGSLLICAQMRDGSQGNPTPVDGILLWEPFDTKKQVGRDDFAVYHGDGTSVDTFRNGDGAVVLSADKFTGTYTTDTIDAGFVAPFLWRVNIEAHEYDAAVVDDLDFDLASGEAAWWTVDGRGASPGLPGVDWERTVDDLSDLTVDSLQDELVHGPRGEAGTHTRVLLESRYTSAEDPVTGWSEWSEHIDGTRVCRWSQFRLTLDRETLTHEAQVHQLIITAHI